MKHCRVVCYVSNKFQRSLRSIYRDIWEVERKFGEKEKEEDNYNMCNIQLVLNSNRVSSSLVIKYTI